MLKLLPDHIAAIDPYIPGKPTEELEREYGIRDSIKMASNENPLGVSEKVIKAICEAAKKVNLYPTGDSYFLRLKLSEKYKIPIDHIICGSGSVDLIEMLPRTFLNHDENVVTSEMSFPSYKIATYMVNTNFKAAPVKNFGLDLDAILGLVDNKTKIVFVANPNNPTGTLIKRKEMDAFIAKLPPEPILVLDEAYFEFIEDPDYPNGLEYLDRRERIFIMRTFSKIHGLAGLRVGYGIGSKEIVSALNKIRSPFNVNAIAQAAALAALDDHDFVVRSRKAINEGLRYLSAEFTRLGIKYIPSYANFIMIFPEKSAADLDEQLKRRGIIVRLGGKSLRISIGTMKQNTRLIKALEELL
jgi:histidinol-phosphate aminotransferase